MSHCVFCQFINLTCKLNFENVGIDGIAKGIYAIVRTSKYDDDEASIKNLNCLFL